MAGSHDRDPGSAPPDETLRSKPRSLQLQLRRGGSISRVPPAVDSGCSTVEKRRPFPHEQPYRRLGEVRAVRETRYQTGVEGVTSTSAVDEIHLRCCPPDHGGIRRERDAPSGTKFHNDGAAGDPLQGSRGRFGVPRTGDGDRLIEVRKEDVHQGKQRTDLASGRWSPAIRIPSRVEEGACPRLLRRPKQAVGGNSTEPGGEEIPSDHHCVRMERALRNRPLAEESEACQ